MHRVIRLNSLHYSLWKTIIRPQVVNIAEFPHIRLRENHWNSWEVAMDSSWPIICLARAAAERYISCTATLCFHCQRRRGRGGVKNLGNGWSKSIVLENKVVFNFDFRNGAKKLGHLDHPLQSYGKIFFNIF